MSNFYVRAKVVAAAISAGVVLGALTMALSGTVTAHAVMNGAGATSTEATPPPLPPTPIATPPVKAKKWQGIGWPGL